MSRIDDVACPISWTRTSVVVADVDLVYKTISRIPLVVDVDDQLFLFPMFGIECRTHHHKDTGQNQGVPVNETV